MAASRNRIAPRTNKSSCVKKKNPNKSSCFPLPSRPPRRTRKPPPPKPSKPPTSTESSSRRRPRCRPAPPPSRAGRPAWREDPSGPERVPSFAGNMETLACFWMGYCRIHSRAAGSTIEPRVAAVVDFTRPVCRGFCLPCGLIGTATVAVYW